MGRFLQADTVVPAPGDPKSLNRYAYVLNNPLNWVDPIGHGNEAYGSFGGGVGPIVSNPVIWWCLGQVTDALRTNVALFVQETAFGLNQAWLLVGDKIVPLADRIQQLAQQNAQNISNASQGGQTGSPNGPWDPWKWGSDYRMDYEDYYGVVRDPNYEVHHILPQKYADILAKANININDPRWLREVQVSGGTNIHQKFYTNAWIEWSASLGERTPSAQEIIRFAQSLEQQYLEQFGTAFYRLGGNIDWDALWALHQQSVQ